MRIILSNGRNSKEFIRKNRRQTSGLGLGGHHLGDAEDETVAARNVHEAIDGGITFKKDHQNVIHRLNGLAH